MAVLGLAGHVLGLVTKGEPFSAKETAVNIDEPFIVINGVRLTQGQAMTLRVAIESFAADLRDNGLGTDEPGIAISSVYLQRIGEIRRLLAKGTL